jgi:VWFA-related protein
MRFIIVVLIGTLSLAGLATASPQDRSSTVFRSSVGRVSVATMVRDQHGRPVTGLTRDDFEVFDGGRPRAIAEFRADATPLTIALLLDYSGSMALADRRDASRRVASDVMTWLTPQDQVGLFIFDKTLRELAPFGSHPSAVLEALFGLKPWGVTSLFDAIAETGRTLAAHAGTHRAIVALTDGGDNASRITAMRASAIAGSIDVPVYLMLVSPTAGLENVGLEAPGLNDQGMDRLADLARWTGGQSHVASTPAHSRRVTRELITELRHQYVIAFAPDPRPGWHGIEIRTRVKNLVVRARSGYTVESRPGGM